MKNLKTFESFGPRKVKFVVPTSQLSSEEKMNIIEKFKDYNLKSNPEYIKTFIDDYHDRIYYILVKMECYDQFSGMKPILKWFSSFDKVQNNQYDINDIEYCGPTITYKELENLNTEEIINLYETKMEDYRIKKEAEKYNL